MKNIKTAKNIKSPFTEEISSIKIIDNENKVHFVPLNNDNTDYQAILQWVADGNTIQEAD
jgi:hypothetical protein|tara:strand:+ start:232 stop:411 length:180 start_codon:yes stop_codon:yes gene_type:complete